MDTHPFMSDASARRAAPPERVALPRSSSARGRSPCLFFRLLSAVEGTPYNTLFEGQIFKPGASIAAKELPDPAVLLECAGPVGSGRARPTLWVLWRYDRRCSEWVEIARAQSLNWEWKLVLRQPAWRALHPHPGPVDSDRRGAQIEHELVHIIDAKISEEVRAVRLNVLSSLYDDLAGRIANF